MIPVLLLVATMVVYVRLRAGLRATMAMTLGALGLVIGKTDLSGIARVLLDPSHAVMTAATTIFSNHMPPAPIVDRIGGIAPRPILLIHAVPGMGGESTRQPEYFAAAGEPRTIWNVPGSSHTGGLDAQPVEYERRVTAFFEAALLDPNRRLERSRP